jgi:hypothetical protein
MIKRRLLALMLIALCALGAWGDETTTRTIAPGVTASSIRREAGPWEVRVIRMRRDQPLIHLDADTGRETIRGLAGVSRIAERVSSPDDYIVAATNGDFYAMSGAKQGLTAGACIAGGELVTSASQRDNFYITADGAPHIGRLDTGVTLHAPRGEIPVARVNRPQADGELELYTARWGWPIAGPGLVLEVEGLSLRSEGRWTARVTETLAAGASREIAANEVILVATEEAAGKLTGLSVGETLDIEIHTASVSDPIIAAVGGKPILVQGGQVVPDDTTTTPRHPRTAVGFSDTEVLLVTVDGRQPGWSVGMRLHTLATLMQELGCSEAINIDGGGSTTAWVRGEIVNRPSDGRERSVANALLAFSRAPVGPLARLEVRPAEIVALAGARVPLDVRLLDEWYNPVATDRAELVVDTVEGEVAAAWDGEALTVGNQAGTGVLALRHPDSTDARAEIPTRVVTTVAAIALQPAEVAMSEGDEVRLQASGLTEGGATVWLPEGVLQWSVEGEGVASLGDGVFRAQRPGVRARAVARLGEATGSAALLVADEHPVEDFEGATPAMTVTRWPEGDVVSASVEVLAEEAPGAGRFCRLTFDLGRPVATRAAYVRLDRTLGNALSISLIVRAQASPAPWLRAALVDGNGTRHTITLAGKLEPGDEWRRLRARLPDGLKPPLIWQSVYVVATAGKTSAGAVDLDDLRAVILPE